MTIQKNIQTIINEIDYQLIVKSINGKVCTPKILLMYRKISKCYLLSLEILDLSIVID